MFPFPGLSNGAQSPISLSQNPTATTDNVFTNGNYGAGLVVYPQPETADTVLANVAQSGGGVGLLVTAFVGVALGAIAFKAFK